MSVNIIIVLKCDSVQDLALNIFNEFKGFRAYLLCYEMDLNRVKVAYIRPVINGCHLYDGIFYSTDPNIEVMIKSKSCNLNGSLVILSVNRDLPYCDLQFKDNKYVMKDSIEVKMINVLAKHFNFVYDVIYANQSWGTFENGVWSGSVGHIFNKTADIALCDLTQTAKRSEAVDFTKAYITVPLTFVTKKPGLKSRKWITITPFSPEVWLSMLSSLLITTTFIQLLYAKCVSTDKRVDSITISLIGTLLQQSEVRIPSDHYSIRIFFWIWFFTSFVLACSYSGVFYSVLTLPEFKDPLETLEDLVMASESGDYQTVTFPNSFYNEMFVKAECCGDYYRIGQNMKNPEFSFPETTAKGIEMINESKEKTIIFINTRVSLTFGVRSNAVIDMHISSDTLMIDQMAMALRRGSPLLKFMDKAIEQFVETGLYDQWMSQTLRVVPAKYHMDEVPLPSESIKNLKLIDIESVFFICISGLSISVSIFFFEFSMNSSLRRSRLKFCLFKFRFTLRRVKRLIKE